MGRNNGIDWKSQLANQFGIEKPKEEQKETNWAQQAEMYNSMSRNNNRGKNDGQNRNSNFNRNASSSRPKPNSAPRFNQNGTASAPYNFVSLPDKIVPAPLDQKLDWLRMDEKELRARFKEYILKQGKLSGRIELELETVTPCFIGGNGESFYAPNGKPVIPGSTLRGMTKNLLKIISCGAMRRTEDFYDHHLYFRDFAGRVKSFREYYKKRMVDMVSVAVKKEDGSIENKMKPRSKASPGFLIRIKGNYYVCPAQAKAVYSPKECNKGPKINWYENGSADVLTGPMNSKKTYMHIEKPVWDEDKRIPVPKNVVEDYRADKNRDGLDLFRKGKTGAFASGYTHIPDVDFVVPCYYTAKNGVVEHFGHGRYYRIAYEKSIGDHVPEKLQEETIDFADALFGAKELWASRLYFDDAQLMGNPVILDKQYSHPLMTPNPTSFQMYLTQNGKEYRHWDTDAVLRGYKLYWHQDIGKEDWKICGSEKPVTGMKQIQPLAKGNRFKANIRFANLNDIELGALCSVFNLAENGEDIVYKIGQGKSIGMGSIRIKAKLFLEDSVGRYQSLFAGDTWNNSEAEQDPALYCQKFKTYFDEMLGEGKKKYDVGMQELRTMLDWKQTKNRNWTEKTAMMNPTTRGDERLKNRCILSDAKKFVEENFKK